MTRILFTILTLFYSFVPLLIFAGEIRTSTLGKEGRDVQDNVLSTEGLAPAPFGLMTDLLEGTDIVWLDGFPSDLSLSDLANVVERYQCAEIRSVRPSFGWIVNDTRRNIVQTACQIQLAGSAKLLTLEKGGAPDFWDSGKMETSDSSNIIYQGKPLAGNTVYYWRVRTWNNGIVSEWSKIKGFKTATHLEEYQISRYPIVREMDRPVLRQNIDAGKTVLCDFGEASFGQIRVELTAREEGQTAVIRVGERMRDGRVDRKPFGTTRFWSYRLNLLPGRHYYAIKTRVDKRNSSGEAFLMPDYIGEVMPFRYAEVESDSPETTTIGEIVRYSAYYPFKETGSWFHCDNESLNQVWHLCRRSIKAASFLGVYVDGDRERIPYGGDSLFQQLIHYGVDREYSLARFTQEYIIFHPTWPSECPMRAVQMAWYDYLYTGDTRNIRKYYDELKIQSLLALSEENGLISTRKGKATRAVLDSIHFKGKEIRDLVDWPQPGFSKGLKGETDGFVFCDFNPVINAYHYFSLISLERFARVLDKKEDAVFFKERAAKVYNSYQKVFFDPVRGIYRDGETTDHAALHSNIFAASMGLVPPEQQKSVLAFIKSRGMACSIFGAKFLLDSVYDLEDGDYGLQLMTEKGMRGWLNMIRMGTTIIPEAWDDSLKPNLDWNHASGGTPGNTIPHKLVGVEPLLPAAQKIRIKPQIGTLKEIDARVPLIRGFIEVKIRRKDKNIFRLEVTIPANVRAEVWIPKLEGAHCLVYDPSEKERIEYNSILGTPLEKERFYLLPDVGSGHWIFETR